MTHALKCWPQYFKEVVSGEKTFEVRKNDRPFLVGDNLLLQEYDNEKAIYTGKEWNGSIVYLMTDPAFVKKGFCVLGIKEKE